MTQTDLRVQTKNWAPQSVKKATLTVFWDMNGPMTIGFQVKNAAIYNASYYQFSAQNSAYLWNCPSGSLSLSLYIYIYIYKYI